MPGKSIVVAWFTFDSYKLVKRLVENDSNFPDTYDEWLKLATKQTSEIAARGDIPDKVQINPSEFARYCRATGQTHNRDTLYAFAIAKKQGRHYWPRPPRAYYCSHGIRETGSGVNESSIAQRARPQLRPWESKLRPLWKGRAWSPNCRTMHKVSRKFLPLYVAEFQFRHTAEAKAERRQQRALIRELVAAPNHALLNVAR